MTPTRAEGRSLAPKGMATFLPEMAAVRRRIERAAFAVFSRRRYHEIVTPMFEYLDVIGRGFGPELAERLYPFVDRSNGRVMVLRPDITAQIARIVAMLLADQPKPLRLCYSANVFRHEDEHGGRERETYQIGAELVGLSGPEADAEIVGLAIEVLQAVGLRGFRIALGHAGFFRSLLEEAAVPQEHRPEIEQVATRKDLPRLEFLLREAGIDERWRRRLLELPGCGPAGPVFDLGARLASGAGSRSALDRLQTVWRILRRRGLSHHLLVDLGEMRGIGYYTGIAFEIFVEGIGYEIGRGGRYDELVGRFGYDCPAIGFALHLERLHAALARSRGARVRSNGHHGSGRAKGEQYNRAKGEQSGR